MNSKTVKALALMLGLGGLVALLTGIGGVEYSFKTGHWSRFEGVSPSATRIVGAILIGMAVLFVRLADKIVPHDQ